MKLKQILLNALTVVIAFEYIGSNILAIMYPSWGGLVIGIMSAVAFVMVFNKAHFYKYRSR
jgi:integral membrane sensor domain MASE1